MAKTKRVATSDPEQQTIERLQERYQSLHTKKIQVETELKNAKNTLDELKKKARDAYGTDVIEELQQKLRDMKTKNEQERAAYQQQLDQIENSLADVEEKFAATESAAETTTEEQ